MHDRAHSVHHTHAEMKAFTAEELIEGHREKYSLEATFGPVPFPNAHHHLSRPIRYLLNAFSHWTYEHSGQTSFVAGFQGVGPVLTEAVIHDVR